MNLLMIKNTKKAVGLPQKVKDRMWLLVVAMGLSVAIYGVIIILHTLNISKEWMLFILASIVYSVGITYAILKMHRLRKNQSRVKFLSLLISTILISVLIAWLVFYFGIVPLPKNLMPYMIGSFVWGLIHAQLFEYCLKLIYRREKVKNNTGTQGLSKNS